MSLRMSSKVLLLSAGALLLSACSGTTADTSGTTTAYDATKPATVMGAMGSAIAAIGTELTSTSRFSNQQSNGQGQFDSKMSASDCDSHGQPSFNNTNDRYPGAMAYCKISVNDGSPDTIQGGFALAKSVACALESANLPFDGTTQSNISIPVTSTCFSQDQMNDMGMSSISANVTSSAPAAFNSYYQRGIEIQVIGMGMTFKIGASVSSTKIEFATFEDQGSDKQGMTAGSLDLTTGEIRYETRMERIDCAENGSCGWNRHIRMYADMEISGGQLGDLESISFAYSNIQDAPGQACCGGELVTASGNLVTGIKARLFNATNGSNQPPTNASQYSVVNKWVEVTNTKCYTSDSEEAGTCGSGIDKFASSTAFVLSGTFTSSQSYFGSHAGLTFSSVNVDADTQ